MLIAYETKSYNCINNMFDKQEHLLTCKITITTKNDSLPSKHASEIHINPKNIKPQLCMWCWHKQYNPLCFLKEHNSRLLDSPWHAYQHTSGIALNHKVSSFGNYFYNWMSIASLDNLTFSYEAPTIIYTIDSNN